MAPTALVGGGLVLAHGVGVRGDLPLPLWVVSYGAAGVLVVTFGLLLRAWPRARLEPPREGVSGPAWTAPALAGLEGLARPVGAGILGVVIAAGLVGPDSPLRNLAPNALYVGAWVGGVVVNAVLGDVWSALNPFETVARLARRLRPSGSSPSWVGRLGVWPATGVLAVFVWLELVHPNPADPRLIGSLLLAFTTVVVLGALWWGPGWPRAVDGFGALFGLVAAMAPLHRDDAGRLRVRPPFVGLTGIAPRRSITALILVALGSTTFDGVSRTGQWEAVLGDLGGWDAVPMATVGLVATVGAVAVLYLWGARGIAGATPDLTVGQAADRFAHTLVPIALGYAVAHYFSLLVFEGQRMVALASDPFGTGADWLGTAAWEIDFAAVSAVAIAVVQVAAIVGGHVVGVVLAHDRAVAVLPEDADPRHQYPLLVAMIGFTIGGLLLLLGA